MNDDSIEPSGFPLSQEPRIGPARPLPPVGSASSPTREREHGRET